MIIWLASYPKSGNTWVRTLISSLLYSSDGIFNFSLLKKIPQFPEKKYFKTFTSKHEDINELKKYWVVAQDKINLDNKIKFFKTHHANCKIDDYKFTDQSNTLATIYVVRDPRSLIKSITNHYHTNDEDSKRFLMTPSTIGGDTVLGTWAQHYHSWTTKNDHLLLIRYEDLISNIDQELNKIILFLKKYLDFDVNEKKVSNILDTTSFSHLKKMEEEKKFDEFVIDKNSNKIKKFFYLGPTNDWRTQIDPTIAKDIEIKFNSEMKNLKYL